MKIRLHAAMTVLALAFSLSLWPGAEAVAQSEAVLEPCRQYEALQKQGRYEEALPFALEALKRSMQTLRNTPDKPHCAHPMFWAPFVVIGEEGT